MKPSICFYFQVHQPYRLRDLRITELGNDDAPAYFDEEKNREIFQKVAEKCYLPANALMLALLKKHPDFRVSYSLSGVFLDQCKEYGPAVLQSFKKLARTGQVEFLGETYYHSLASLASLEEFCEQVEKHATTIEKLFGVRPKIFRNTELIYSNELAHVVRLLGFRGILAEGADHVLLGRSPNVPYVPPKFRLPRASETIIRKHRIHPQTPASIKVLLKNYRLSDDVAFRFSDKSWIGYPLHADRFTEWLLASGGHSVNLFMDYETFGEHQWADTGIFEFVRALPALWRERGVACKTPSDVIASFGKKTCDTLDVHVPMSWADMERDLSEWRSTTSIRFNH
jgi:alpha-amylase